MPADRFITALFVCTTFFTTQLFAETPTDSEQSLFFIERSKNANEVHYVARLTECGELDLQNPVRAYWINWETDSTGKYRTDLTFVQKKLAFGFSIDRLKDPHSCALRLACFKKRPIKVYVADGNARAVTSINSREARLKKIKVVTRENKIMPTVLSVTVFGTDVETGDETSETILPD